MEELCGAIWKGYQALWTAMIDAVCDAEHYFGMTWTIEIHSRGGYS